MKILNKSLSSTAFLLGMLSFSNFSFGAPYMTDFESPSTEVSSDEMIQLEEEVNSMANHAENDGNDVLSAIDLDQLRQQLAAHWKVPAELKNTENLYVDIKVEMNPDCTVRSATLIKTSKDISDPNMKSVAESALRSIRNAGSLKLPLDRYDLWKTFTIRFNPQHML